MNVYFHSQIHCETWNSTKENHTRMHTSETKLDHFLHFKDVSDVASFSVDDFPQALCCCRLCHFCEKRVLAGKARACLGFINLSHIIIFPSVSEPLRPGKISTLPWKKTRHGTRSFGLELPRGQNFLWKFCWARCVLCYEINLNNLKSISESHMIIENPIKIILK